MLCANSLPPAAAAAAAQLNLCCINIARAVLALLQVNLELYSILQSAVQFNPYLKCQAARAALPQPQPPRRTLLSRAAECELSAAAATQFAPCLICSAQ